MEENAIALLKNNVDLDGWMAVEGVKYLLNIVVIAMTSSIILVICLMIVVAYNEYGVQAPAHIAPLF